MCMTGTWLLLNDTEAQIWQVKEIAIDVREGEICS